LPSLALEQRLIAAHRQPEGGADHGDIDKVAGKIDSWDTLAISTTLAI